MILSQESKAQHNILSVHVNVWSAVTWPGHNCDLIRSRNCIVMRERNGNYDERPVMDLAFVLILASDYTALPQYKGVSINNRPVSIYNKTIWAIAQFPDKKGFWCRPWFFDQLIMTYHVVWCLFYLQDVPSLPIHKYSSVLHVRDVW